MRKQLKTIICALLTLTFCLGLLGCAGKPLPEGFDADEVGSAAEEIVGLATTGDYDSIMLALREDLKESITADQLREGWAAIYEKAGAFESIAKVALSGTADSDSGEEYAVAQLLVKHENASLVYTLSFDKNLALVGIYLK